MVSEGETMNDLDQVKDLKERLYKSNSKLAYLKLGFIWVCIIGVAVLSYSVGWKGIFFQ